MRRNQAIQALELRQAPAKRVAAWKANETAKEHVIVQEKKENVDEHQDLPTKEDLGKKVMLALKCRRWSGIPIPWLPFGVRSRYYTLGTYSYITMAVSQLRIPSELFHVYLLD